MTMKSLLTVAAIGFAAALSAPGDASAGGKKPYKRDDQVARDCKPINGPDGYYGNPWCDGGWKYAEDYPPGTGPYLDLFDLPQVRRLSRRLDRWD